MADKETRSSFVEREIRMVLVGKTGVGKSATGNTIAGAEPGIKNQIFKAMAKVFSVTKKCQQHSFKRFGYDLQLIDVPGFCDTDVSEKDINKEIVKCVGMSSPGIHAILVVVRIGRFTKEDKETLDKFLRCFGKEAKRFVIVVFTGKDDMEEGGDTMEGFIGECPPVLKQFLFDAGFRFIFVNNRGSAEEKETFTKALITKVKNMVDGNGGQCYTDNKYRECEAGLREAEKKEKLDEKRQKQLEEKVKQEADAFKKQLQSQHLEMQVLEAQLLKQRNSMEKEQENQMKERLKAIQIRVKNDEENKHMEEEKKRHEEEKKRLEEEKKRLQEEQKRLQEQKAAEANMRRELEIMKEFQREQTENYERKIEDLRREEARKQIREKVENDDTSYFNRAWQWCASWF